MFVRIICPHDTCLHAPPCGHLAQQQNHKAPWRRHWAFPQWTVPLWGSRGHQWPARSKHDLNHVSVWWKVCRRLGCLKQGYSLFFDAQRSLLHNSCHMFIWNFSWILRHYLMSYVTCDIKDLLLPSSMHTISLWLKLIFSYAYYQ